MFLNIFVVAFEGPDATLYERILTTAWNDRGWRVREGGCYLLRHTLDQMIDGLFQGKVSRRLMCLDGPFKSFLDQFWTIEAVTKINPAG